MRKLSLVVIVLILGLLVAGAAFLAAWDIPPPGDPIVRQLPDDRFPR